MAVAGHGVEGPARARSRGRPNPETAARIDGEIIEAARILFFEHGYAGTSMAMVVKAAKVSKTTLYARYAAKSDLFKAAVGRTIESNADAIFPADRSTTGLAEGLIQYADSTLLIGTTTPWADFERLVFAEGPQFPELSDIIGERIETGIQEVASFISACSARDGVECRSPEKIARLYIIALRGFYTTAILLGREPHRDERLDFVHDLVAKLMASRPIW